MERTEHPTYVLVPQYSYITVDNKWQTFPEVDETIELLRDIARREQVDTNRLYTTGQSYRLSPVCDWLFEQSK